MTVTLKHSHMLQPDGFMLQELQNQETRLCREGRCTPLSSALWSLVLSHTSRECRTRATPSTGLRAILYWCGEQSWTSRNALSTKSWQSFLLEHLAIPHSGVHSSDIRTAARTSVTLSVQHPARRGRGWRCGDGRLCCCYLLRRALGSNPGHSWLSRYSRTIWYRNWYCSKLSMNCGRLMRICLTAW